MAVTLRERLFGFAGLGGLAWYASIFRGGGSLPEDLSPQQVEAPGMQAVDVAGERVAYLDEGQGDEALLFIHGFGESTRTWDLVRPAFASRYRTVAVDLWGFGASGRPRDARQWSWASQVQGLLDHLGIKQAVFIGHSLGGRVSLMCARQMPERVRAVALVDADWGQAPFGYALVRLIAYSTFLPLSLARLRSRLEPWRGLMKGVAGPVWQVTDEQLDIWRSYLRVRGTTRTWQSLARSQRPSDVRGLPETVTCPARVIWGDQDVVVPLGFGQALAERLPQADLVVIPHSGHFPQEEHPEAVVAALGEFLGTLPPLE